MNPTQAVSSDGSAKPGVSERKQEANRRNALRSTGPRTPEGKARVSVNALKHGLAATDVVVLPLENADQYTEFADAARIELQPVGVIEGVLVDQIIAGLWRWRRAGRLETGVLATKYRTIATEEEAEQALQRGYTEIVGVPAEDAEADTTRVGQAYLRSMLALSTLSRYETTISRSVQRAWRELKRLQRARQDQDVQAPLALEQAGEPVSTDTNADEPAEPVEGETTADDDEDSEPPIEEQLAQ
jgi:hypothetical protein